MSNQSYLRREFIKKFRDHHFTLELILEQLGIRGDTLHRWFSQRSFRRQLNAARKTLRLRTQLELELGKSMGTNRLIAIAQGRFSPGHPPTHVQRLACNNLSQADTHPRKRPNPRRAWAKRNGIDPNAEINLAHPDVGEDEAKALLKEMEEGKEEIRSTNDE